MYGLLTPIIIGAVARILIPKIAEKAADQSSQVLFDRLNDELPKILNQVGGFLDQQTDVTWKLSKHVEGTTINIMDAFFRNFQSTLGGTVTDFIGGSVNTVGSNLLLTAGKAATGNILAGGLVGTGLKIVDTATKNYLINKVEKKYQSNLVITINAIDQARERTISDIRSVVGEVDAVLEKRINQVAILVMEVITFAIEIADRFSPEAFREKLVKPTLEEIKFLEKEFFQDLGKQVDHFFDRAEDLEQLVDQRQTAERTEIRRGLNQPSGNDIQVYNRMKSEALASLNETTSIQVIVETYGQLQLESWRTVAIFRNAPALKQDLLEEWVKYGRLCGLWQDARAKTALIYSSQNKHEVGTDMSLTPIESMLARINELEALQKNALAQSVEIDRLKAELTAKTREIDDLKAELKTKTKKIDRLEEAFQKQTSEIDLKMKALEKKLSQNAIQSGRDNTGGKDSWSAFERQ
ncbi:coiled-coil domain-containing protein [Roseofilum casamattae]|uniref:Uncharacterized protein n=1 Tax=Roseofilum casamattae BLCC-M143 TaxID=3022442 RepID=A0ABT7BTM3_9CYAN|nr:hypothetical protein [Roseofilum casamattae]MDJ1182533.1 hypothetical protein [Roseofilum casamattae BLCC-M143]